ncbi:MAG: polysaccharide deacetylase family protein [Ignavibacteria bacterium]|nr:polysaccharide deacetylase family protein [Ignavibacteria bacterium]
MVPLLITMDLETARDHNIEEQNAILKTINSDFCKLNLPLTIFLTSDSLDRFNEGIQKLNTPTNEFGIHGFDHSINENYSLLGEEEIRKNIEHVFNNIRNRLNRIPETFRGPYMSTSSLTQKVLIEKISDLIFQYVRREWIL